MINLPPADWKHIQAQIAAASKQSTHAGTHAWNISRTKHRRDLNLCETVKIVIFFLSLILDLFVEWFCWSDSENRRFDAELKTRSERWPPEV